MKLLHVEKKIEDTKMVALKNTYVNPSQISKIIKTDADVYTKDGVLLLKFRKGVLKKNDLENYFDATYKYTITNTSKNRGSASGSKAKNITENTPVSSTILGYFDKWAPNQKSYFRKFGITKPVEVRETMFSYKYPEKMKKVVPLIKRIDTLYKKLLPKFYNPQNAKAKQTHFKIANTAFTTITTNVNFRTSIHKDKGDDEDGFGNLAVIERGKYTGGETCFPQYGIGVDVREGDILFMNVHEWHGNLETKYLSKDAVRMSIVCYLRTNIWKRTKNKTKKFKDSHFNTIKKMYKKLKKNRTRKTLHEMRDTHNATVIF
jgi:hypothetical protein